MTLVKTRREEEPGVKTDERASTTHAVAELGCNADLQGRHRICSLQKADASPLGRGLGALADANAMAGSLQ